MDPSGLFGEYAAAHKPARDVRPGLVVLGVAASITMLKLIVELGEVLDDIGLDTPSIPRSYDPVEEAEEILGKSPRAQPTPHPVPVPIPVPTPGEPDDDGCDPQAFGEWWSLLPTVFKYADADWYRYELQVARNNGNPPHGLFPRDTGFVDADGIRISTCTLVDAKYWSPSFIHERANQQDFYNTDLLDEFQGYYQTIQYDYGEPNAQPREFIVVMPQEDIQLRNYFERHMQNVGFLIEVNSRVMVEAYNYSP